MEKTAMKPTQQCHPHATCRGFTLVEVMVTVVIVAILSAVALPAYTNYVTQGRIPDATATLSAKQVQMEQYFQDRRTYEGAPACNDESHKYFGFSCSEATATAFVLEASGTGSMDGFRYTVNQRGAKATPGVPSGWTSSTTCWVVKKDGSC
jgi:type IV pilus assembly protein PilE